MRSIYILLFGLKLWWWYCALFAFGLLFLEKQTAAMWPTFLHMLQMASRNLHSDRKCVAPQLKQELKTLFAFSDCPAFSLPCRRNLVGYEFSICRTLEVELSTPLRVWTVRSVAYAFKGQLQSKKISHAGKALPFLVERRRGFKEMIDIFLTN